MTKLKLKLATANDTSTIYQLADKIWHHHYVPIVGVEQVDYMLDLMYSDEALTKQMREGHKFYLIEIDNESKGFLGLSGDVEVFIHKFYIDQDLQGKGYGQEVFNLIKEEYPKATSYTLTVNRQNFKSINFYFKLGFKIDHIDDFDIGNGYFMNDFIMKYKC